MSDARIDLLLQTAKKDLASRNFVSLNESQAKLCEKAVGLFNEDEASSSIKSDSRRFRRTQARDCLSKIAREYGQETSFLCAIAIPISTLGPKHRAVESVVKAQHTKDGNPQALSNLCKIMLFGLLPGFELTESNTVTHPTVAPTPYPRKRCLPSEHDVETLPPFLRQHSTDCHRGEVADSSPRIASTMERESDDDSTDNESDSEVDDEDGTDECQQPPSEVVEEKHGTDECQRPSEVAEEKPGTLSTRQMRDNLIGNVYELSFKDLVVIAASEDNPSILLTIPVLGETHPFVTIMCTKTTSMQLMKSRPRLW